VRAVPEIILRNFSLIFDTIVLELEQKFTMGDNVKRLGKIQYSDVYLFIIIVVFGQVCYSE